MRRLWRLFWRFRSHPWRRQYRYGCSCGRFTSNNARTARKHALGRGHWVRDYKTDEWVTHARFR